MPATKLRNPVRKKPGFTIVDAVNDPRLFKNWFKNPASWQSWYAFHKAVFGLGMNAGELDLYNRYTKRTDNPDKQFREVYLICGRRAGKALALDTPIPTPNGWTTMGQIHPGDTVLSPEGTAIRVKSVMPIEHGRPCYRVHFKDGTSIVADAAHEWEVHDYAAVKSRARRSKGSTKRATDYISITPIHRFLDCYFGARFGSLTVVDYVAYKPTKFRKTESGIGASEILEAQNLSPDQKENHPCIGWLCECDCGATTITQTRNLNDISTCGCASFNRPQSTRRGPTIVETQDIYDGLKNGKELWVRSGSYANEDEAPLTIHPYVLGVWLGDGDTCGDSITSMDDDIIEEVMSCGYGIRSIDHAHTPAPAKGFQVLGLMKQLRALGLSGNKHIPAEYLRASRQQRIELLMGLADTDGYACGKGCLEIASKHQHLAEQIFELARSLGYRARLKVKNSKLAYANNRDYVSYMVIVYDMDFNPFKCNRKNVMFDSRLRQKPSKEYGLVKISHVEPVASVPVRCIEVDHPDGLFLAGHGFTTTHNSLNLALLAVYLGCFIDWRPYLAPGERATIMVIAAERSQARIIFRYIQAFLTNVELLANIVQRETSEIIELERSVSIEIHTASFRSTRGYTIPAVLCDEIAFWRSDESNNPDEEILAALEPAMATMPGAMILAASSPYSRKGVLYKKHQSFFGVNDEKILVWQASTREMNPGVDESIIERAYQEDPFRAKAEYGGLFRDDVETLFRPAMVKAVTDEGVEMREYSPEYIYYAFVDPSGGSRDSMTLGIAHDEDGKRILDLVEERTAPFSPEEVVSDFVEILKRYQIDRVTGDRYGGLWPAERFEVHGVMYEVASSPKSDIYLNLLAGINSGQVRLLDHPRTFDQITGLERRNRGTGKSIIDHDPAKFDDLANAAAGALWTVPIQKPVEIW